MSSAWEKVKDLPGFHEISFAYPDAGRDFFGYELPAPNLTWVTITLKSFIPIETPIKEAIAFVHGVIEEDGTKEVWQDKFDINTDIDMHHSVTRWTAEISFTLVPKHK